SRASLHVPDHTSGPSPGDMRRHPTAGGGRPARPGHGRAGPAALRAALLVLIALAGGLGRPTPHAQTAERAGAAPRARRGAPGLASERLHERRRRYRDDGPAAAALAVILHGAGRNAEALEVFEASGPDPAPAYALLAGARAARAAGQLEVADAYLAR